MVGAERELREMIQGGDAENIAEYYNHRGMKLQFTIPVVPHQNGCAGAMVKSVKKALNSV